MYIINNNYLYIIVICYILALYVSSFKQPPAKYPQPKYDVIRHLELWETSKCFVLNGIKEVVCWQGSGERSVDLHIYFTLLSSVCHVCI
jgi:hypothetical protein